MKFLHFILIMAAAVMAVPVISADIHMAGDSTMANYGQDVAPVAGWGMYVQELVKPGVKVYNYARSGTTTRSFRKHFWNRLLARVKPGDFVFIQFGHNDGGKSQIDPDGEYQDNLRKCIAEVRARKGIPVLLTQTPYCEFKNGQIRNRDYQQRYIDAVRKVAGEEKAELLDHNAIMIEKLVPLGKEEAAKLYLNLKKGEYPAFPNGKRDICHLRDRGGRFFARGAAEYAFRHKLAVSALFKTLE